MRKLIYYHVKKSRKETVLLTDEGAGFKRMDNIINHIVIEHKKLYSYKGLNTNTTEYF